MVCFLTIFKKYTVWRLKYNLNSLEFPAHKNSVHSSSWGIWSPQKYSRNKSTVSTIIGFTELKFNQFLQQPLTTIRHPQLELGYQTFKLLNSTKQQQEFQRHRLEFNCLRADSRKNGVAIAHGNCNERQNKFSSKFHHNTIQNKGL